MGQHERKKKPYTAPSFARLDPGAAKTTLESNSVPGDQGAKAMLKVIKASKAELRPKVNVEVRLPSGDRAGEVRVSAEALKVADIEVLRKMLVIAEEVLRSERGS